MCRTKLNGEGAEADRSQAKQKPKPTRGRVQMVTDQYSDYSDDDDHAFAIGEEKCKRTTVRINNNEVKIIVDTGASLEVMSKSMWLNIKKADDELKPTNAKVFTYATNTPLKLEGQ